MRRRTLLLTGLVLGFSQTVSGRLTLSKAAESWDPLARGKRRGGGKLL